VTLLPLFAACIRLHRRDGRSPLLFEDIPSRGILSADATKGVSVKETKTYSVPGMHCGHCEAAVTNELKSVAGVEDVAVDLDTKLVTITGASLEDSALRAAIDEAGYEAEEVAA
jgi:copper chaperone